MKRSRKRKVRTKIVLRYFVTLAASAALGFIFLEIFGSLIRNFALEFLEANYSQEVIDFCRQLYYSHLAELFFYIVIALIVTFIFLVRTAGFIDKGYNAFSGIVEDDYEAPHLPSAIRGSHRKIESSVKTALKYREYVAKEAEQRKNDLVVYLAHDLKTPLTSIIGYLTLLEESPELPAEYKAKYTGITLEKAYRLEQLINEFFDITRFNLQSITLENNNIELVMMLHQIAEEFYPVLMEKNLRLNIKAKEKINIIGDADKLSRVFDNLMRNAVNYSYPDSQILISAYVKNGYAVVSFKNKGDTIPKEKLEMVFEKFFRADASRQSSTGGAGLGLAIAKQIVEKHGGRISAKSENNITSFTVILKLPENEE